MFGRFRGKMFAPFLLAVLLFMSSAAYAEEDLRFVDSHGTTAYYVDLGTVREESDQVLEARIVVIKAATNRMYDYSMRINHGVRMYRILSTKVLVYDTRELLESAGMSETARPYGTASMIQEIVDYILYPERR